LIQYLTRFKEFG